MAVHAYRQLLQLVRMWPSLWANMVTNTWKFSYTKQSETNMHKERKEHACRKLFTPHICMYNVYIYIPSAGRGGGLAPIATFVVVDANIPINNKWIIIVNSQQGFANLWKWCINRHNNVQDAMTAKCISYYSTLTCNLVHESILEKISELFVSLLNKQFYK